MKHKLKYIIIGFLTVAPLVSKVYAQDDTKPKEEVKVTDAKIKLTFDTTGGKHIIATITGKDASGAEVPVKGVTVAIVIKKSFGKLPVLGDNMATDEAGAVSVDFPKAMPGDKNGNDTVVASVDADAKVGTLETVAVTGFGIPSQPENNLNKRALWAAAASAPISLVVAVNSILLLVWGTIFYILFKLITISKSGKNEKLVKS